MKAKAPSKPKYAKTRADWYQANKAQILEMQRLRRERKRQERDERVKLRAGWIVEASRIWITAARAQKGLTVKDLRSMLADLESSH